MGAFGAPLIANAALEDPVNPALLDVTRTRYPVPEVTVLGIVPTIVPVVWVLLDPIVVAELNDPLASESCKENVLSL